MCIKASILSREYRGWLAIRGWEEIQVKREKKGKIQKKKKTIARPVHTTIVNFNCAGGIQRAHATTTGQASKKNKHIQT